MSLARRASLNIAVKALGELGRFAWALLLILVARHRGGESLGRIAFAYSFTTIFVLLTDLGVNVAEHSLSRNPEASPHDRDPAGDRRGEPCRLVLCIHLWAGLHPGDPAVPGAGGLSRSSIWGLSWSMSSSRRITWPGLRFTGAACAINVAGNLPLIPVSGLSIERRESWIGPTSASSPSAAPRR